MPENILEKIIQKKIKKVDNLKKTINIKSLEKLISENKTYIDFKSKIQNNIKNNKTSIIAEIKKASPSAGVIIENYYPVKIAKIYDKYLSNLPIITPIKQREANSSYHLYTIRIKNGDRKKIFNFLRKNKIGVNVHYIPVVLHPFYKKLGFKLKKYPHSLSFYRDSISIPIYPDLKFKDQLKVIRCIKSQF